uniref:Hydrophobin n=1 Tax=Tricholoma vaccinum TaxID=56470 RepID=A0A024BKH3_9AGAR|nr:hydrophobin 7 [Tricholoma vaccinum]
MKFFAVFTILAAAIVAVCASHAETNAVRFARGLPPLPPHRRATPVAMARRSSPSGSPSGGQCNTGPVQCCNSVTTANHQDTSILLGLLGLVLDPSILVGLQCSPLNVLGVGGNSCSQQPVCCENNNYNGLIVIGCSPITL